MSLYKMGYFSGSPMDIGLSIGNSIKNRLDEIIDYYIFMIDKIAKLDYDKLKNESLKWLYGLPPEFVEEFEGMSKASGSSLDRIAQYIYSNMCSGCTSFVYLLDGDVWVGRNNDYIIPGIWGYINVISKTGFIPVMIFGQEGTTFSGTGYNREKLWLNYNWLPGREALKPDEKAVPGYVFIRMALESCHNLSDLEHFLNNTIRDTGMNLFAVDGKDNSYNVYECDCKSFVKRNKNNIWIAGANHYTDKSLPFGDNTYLTGSFNRQHKMEMLLGNLGNFKLPEDFIKILSDPEIEAGSEGCCTVYSNIACPAKDMLWYAHNGTPAPSKSIWEKVEWAW